MANLSHIYRVYLLSSLVAVLVYTAKMRRHGTRVSPTCMINLDITNLIQLLCTARITVKGTREGHTHSACPVDSEYTPQVIDL